MPPAPPRSIAARLLDLSAPIIGLNVLNVLSLAVDTAMCGRLANAEDALTALGFATQVIFLLMIGMIGVTVGTVALVSRAWGAHSSERLDHIVWQSLLLTIGLGGAVAFGGNLVAHPVLVLLGASDSVADLGMAYLRPLLAGSVFNYLLILQAALLRAVGNTRLAFFVALLQNALNVVFNYALILGHWGLPALGVQGAAIGTVISQAIGVLVLTTLLRRGLVAGLALRFGSLRPDWQLVRQFIRVGAPAALDMVVLNAAFLSIVGMLGRIAPIAVAAHGIGLRIQALAFVPGMSVSQATGAMVGQALGAGDIAGARAVLRASMRLATTIMTSLAVILIVAATPLVGIFDLTPGSELARLSVLWIRVLGFGMPVVGVYIAFVGLLQGSGATRVSLRISVLATLLFQVPVSALLGFTAGLGVFGVWIAFPLGFIVKATLAFLAYRKGDWARTGTEL